MTFGENLKILRNSRSVSQKELAETLGFSFQNISKWERNESQPDIETLIQIARFFSTTTDALLGFAPEERFCTLSIDQTEAEIYHTYPKTEKSVGEKIVFAIDGEGKITGITFIPRGRKYRGSYIRNAYEPFAEASTLVYECAYRLRNGDVVDNKRVKIPEDGFLLAVSDRTFAAKKIVEFITPEEYAVFLNSDTHPDYYNTRNGKNLFSDILRHNELDTITVERDNLGVRFKKTAATVDPMALNIETLGKIVRKELQKEHDQQIQLLQDRIDELEDMISDNECQIDDLDGRVNDIEAQLSEKDS